MTRLLLALFAGTGITACLVLVQAASSQTLIDRLLRPGSAVSQFVFSSNASGNYTMAVQTAFIANAVIYSALVFLLVVFFEGPRGR